MKNIEKMTAGKIYHGVDKEIHQIAKKSHQLCHDYNALYDTDPKRKEILKELLPHASEGIYLQGDIYFDYGVFTTIGKNFYANYGLRVLDTCPVHIGDNVYMGVGVSINTPLHPLVAEERRKHIHDDGMNYADEYGKPIRIGNDCWIGSNVCILPGVTIGDNCVIGAGSVVTRDIPSDCLAFGNPCRVKRKITKEDSIFLKKELW